MVTGAWDTAVDNRGMGHSWGHGMITGAWDTANTSPIVACGVEFDCTDSMYIKMDSPEHFDQNIPSPRFPSPSYPLLLYFKVTYPCEFVPWH